MNKDCLVYMLYEKYSKQVDCGIDFFYHEKKCSRIFTKKKF